LWLDKSTERSYANLRSALWRLRRPAERLIDCAGPSIRLADDVEVDVDVVADIARGRLRTGDHADVLLCGDLLPDWYDDWVVLERERVRQVRLHALEALCHHLTSVGRHADAVVTGMAAIGAEPLRESAHFVLIEAHLAEGNTAEAVRQYVRFCHLVRDALGVNPSARLNALLAEAVDLDVIDGLVNDGAVIGGCGPHDGQPPRRFAL
jgi:DNA-binding SARP family transcriptional activator